MKKYPYVPYDYTPYGVEWRRELMKHPKSFIVGLAAMFALSATVATDLLEILGNDDHAGLREYIARVTDNPQLLGLFATDYCELVRIFVALNPNTSIETLELLAGDDAANVADAAKNTLANRRRTN